VAGFDNMAEKLPHTQVIVMHDANWQSQSQVG